MYLDFGQQAVWICELCVGSGGWIQVAHVEVDELRSALGGSGLFRVRGLVYKQ